MQFTIASPLPTASAVWRRSASQIRPRACPHVVCGLASLGKEIVNRGFIDLCNYETHISTFSLLPHAIASMPLSMLSSVVPRFVSRRRAVLKEPTSQLVKLSPTEALHHYSTPGISPPSARVDPKLRISERRPPRVWEYWKYAVVAATKGASHCQVQAEDLAIDNALTATHVTSEVVSHTLWGPRRKTWGIEMTLVTSLLRQMERHADLVNIVRTMIGCALPPPLSLL